MRLKCLKINVQSKSFRALLHLPVGIFTVFCGYVNWSCAIIFFLGFMAYEITEDWRIKDGAYIDIFGYLIGLALGVVGLFIYKGV